MLGKKRGSSLQKDKNDRSGSTGSRRFWNRKDDKNNKSMKKKESRPFLSRDRPKSSFRNTENHNSWRGYEEASQGRSDVPQQQISSIFYLNSAPSSPTTSDKNRSLSGMNVFGALEERIKNGVIPGVQLVFIDRQSCRCLVRCDPLSRGKRRLENKVLFKDLENEVDSFFIQLLIIVEKNSSNVVASFAVIPRSTPKSIQLREVYETLLSSLERERVHLRDGVRLIENVLQHVVCELTRACDLNAQVKPFPLPSQQIMFDFDLSESLRWGGFAEVHTNSNAPQNKSDPRGEAGQTITSSTVPGRVQPCPRLSGASFSPSGLLVSFNNGGMYRSLISRQKLKSAHAGEEPPSRNGAPLPRTLTELHLLMESNIEEKRSKTSQTISAKRGGSFLSRFSGVDNDVGIAEEITLENLSEVDVRAHPSPTRSGKREPNGNISASPRQERFSRKRGRRTRGDQDVEDSHEIDTKSTIDVQNEEEQEQEEGALTQHVNLFDISCVSFLHRFLGRTYRMGPLESTKQPWHDQGMVIEVKDAFQGKLGSENPVEEVEDTYESLICWYDDFSDESIEKFDRVPTVIANMQASKIAGRFDLVQTWLALCLISGANVTGFENLFHIPPEAFQGSRGIHPCSHLLIEQLFTEYIKIRDVQTLAAMACVLDAQQQMCHPSDHDILKPPMLLNSRLKLVCDKFRIAYADILHRWGLNVRRAEVMKYVCPQANEKKAELSFALVCPQCNDKSATVLCERPDCRSRGVFMRCAICDVAVRGIGTFCPMCGHGGHSEHMYDWFLHSNECPTGCGCKCATPI